MSLKNNNVQFKPISETFLSIRKKPINITPEHESIFAKEYEKIIKSSGIFTYKDAGVTKEGLVLNRHGLINESLVHIDANKWFNIYWIFLKKLLANKQYSKSKVALTYNNWTEGYFHWMTETIPRVMIANRYLNHEELDLLMPKSLHPIYSEKSAFKSLIVNGNDFINDYSFYQESLLPFNFKKIKFLDNDIYYFDELNLIEKPADTGNYNDKLMRSIRSMYLSYAREKKLLKNDSAKYIYASRSKAKRRKIINELEIIDVLKEFNFEILHFEDYNFWDQINIANSAKILISQHGASLTNMLFMNENSSIFELKASNDRSNHCYFSLANALEIKYFYQLCNIYNDKISVQDSDIKVDINIFRNNLISIINAQ